MANWFTRAVDKVTPWDRGGELQRRQERKKREEEVQQQNFNQAPQQSGGLRVTDNQSTQRVVVDTPQQPKPQQPENIFETLNKGLVFNKPSNAVDIIRSAGKPVETPKPGMVVRPTVQPKEPLRVTSVARDAYFRLPDNRVVNTKPAEETPESIINRGLDSGKSFEDIARENNYKLDGIREYANVTRPNYGIKLERPQQGNLNKIRDRFDANTDADKFRRQEGNKTREAGTPEKDITLVNPGNIVGRTPVIGHITKGLNTLGAQIPQLSFLADSMFQSKMRRDLDKQLAEAKKNGNRFTKQEINRKIDILDKAMAQTYREQEAAYTMFEKNKGGLFNTGTLYDEEGSRKGDAETALKDIALPTAVAMLDLYTLGKGNLLTEGVKAGGAKSVLSKGGANILEKKAGQEIIKNVGRKELAQTVLGNYASGDLGARAEGATGLDPIKAGAINSTLGTATDVGLPALWKSFRTKVIPKILRGDKVAAKDVINEIDDTAISSGAEAVNQAARPRVIPVRQGIPIKQVNDIPINVPESLPQSVNVRNLNQQRSLIQDVSGGESVVTPPQLTKNLQEEARSAAAFDANKASRPTQEAINKFEGVTPGKADTFKLDENTVARSQEEAVDTYAKWLKDMGEGNGVNLIDDGAGGKTRVSNNVRFGDTKGKRMTKAMWREEAQRQLDAGIADPGIQKMFNDAADPELQSMLVKGEPTPDLPQGRPITVKQVKGIDVRDNTVVPQNLPETPGTVRVTTSTALTNTKSELIASQPIPIPIPKVGSTTPDGKIVTKRDVARMRENRKNTKAYNKAQEEIADTISRMEQTKPGAQSSDGFVPTGEFAKGRRGNVIEKVSNELEDATAQRDIAQMSNDDVIQNASTNKATNGGYSQSDFRNIKALFDAKRLKRGTPEYNAANAIRKEIGTQAGQFLQEQGIKLRRTASADELTGYFERKIYGAVVDPTKIDSKMFDDVEFAQTKYTQARDASMAAEEAFRKNPTKQTLQAVETAKKAEGVAFRNASTTELDVAQRVLKNNAEKGSDKLIKSLESEADLNMMDYFTASQLSGPATGFRNFFGTELAGVENRLFANTRAKIANKLFKGGNVGGYDRASARAGRVEGMAKFGDDINRRSVYSGWNPLKQSRNLATTVNSAGESSLHSQIESRLGSYYKNQLKSQGLSGEQLNLQTQFLRMTDPANIRREFQDSAMKSSGLSGIYQKSKQIESGMAKGLGDAIAGAMGGVIPENIAQGASKAIMRIALGYPTATGNFIAQSTKRLMVGVPSLIEMGVYIAKKDKQAAALAFDKFLKEAGSGSAMLGFGYVLGQQGLVTGPYPSDPDERAQWERDGKSENSIRINGAWYPIPQGMGMFGLPILTGAAIGRENDSNESLKEMFTPKNLGKLLPTDQLQGSLGIINGNGTDNELKNFVASTIRTTLPAGSLFNQVSKGLDPTKNDTTTKDFWNNVFDQVITGIPGQNKFADIPDKTDKEGNVIKNPNFLQVMTGASTAVQGGGEQRSAEINQKTNDILKNIDKYGALQDETLKSVLDGSAKDAYVKAQSGKQLDESDIKALQEGLVKGVSSEGTDTAYLEKGQYDTNLIALRLKKDLIESDPTTKPSSLKDLDTAIKRGEVYKENQTPYEDITDYKDIGVEEWRKMGDDSWKEDGDPQPDEYDPEMYQKLWEIDQMMTKAGVSYGKKLDKNKYSIKEKGTGSGRGKGSGARKLDTSFGTLKSGSFAPSVQQYESIDAKSGSIPIIRTIRPNIVHKITSSR